jgi:hypothetical protein
MLGFLVDATKLDNIRCSVCLCSAVDGGGAEHKHYCPASLAEPELNGRGMDTWCAGCGQYCGGAPLGEPPSDYWCSVRRGAGVYAREGQWD